MSVKVIVIKGKPIEQFLLSKDVTTIGRKSDCDISIKDPAVSGTHAKIQKVGDNYLIQDLGSTNGIHIDGRQVKQQVIKNNDVFVVGEHKIKFLVTSDQTKIKTRLEDSPIKQNTLTNIIDDKKQKAPGITSLSSSPLAMRREGGHGYLLVSSGAEKGKKIPLEEGLTTIGTPGVQIAAISKRPSGHFIIHVDGGKDKNKVPMVNGEPTGFKSQKLEPGDKIEVADTEMEYYLG